MRTAIAAVALVSKADAEATLGEPVRTPQLRNGDGADGYYSRCNYYSQPGDKSLVLRVRQMNGGKLDAKKEFDLLSAGSGKLKAIPGLGDRAAIGPASPAVGSTRALLLYVAKGNALVTVGIGGLTDENAATEKAKALAQKIVSRL
ncbi:MAG: hypothetical protein M3Z64_07855 [Verrucomicrobiota bacterium]|nr:hypothetical protein [Verrucomicrobiota bacterium]